METWQRDHIQRNLDYLTEGTKNFGEIQCHLPEDVLQMLEKANTEVKNKLLPHQEYYQGSMF